MILSELQLPYSWFDFYWFELFCQNWIKSDFLKITCYWQLHTFVTAKDKNLIRIKESWKDIILLKSIPEGING